MSGPIRLAIRPRVALGVIAAVAFFVRLLHVLSVESIPTNDMAVFVEMATRRLTLATLFTPEGFCTYTPGYALFLKPFYLLVPDPAVAERAVQIAQAALGAWTCVLLYHLARHLHSRRAGLVAATLTCFFPHYLFYTSNWMSENLFIPVYYAALLLILRAAERPGRLAFFRAGLLAGAAALVRPAALALAPAALYAAWRGAPDPKRRLLALGLVAAGVLGVVLPWGIRNEIALGRFTLFAPYGGITFARGNNPDATGTTGDLPSVPGDIFEQSVRYRAMAIEFITNDPVGALQITLRRKWQAFWEMVVPWPLYEMNSMLFAGEHFFLMFSWRSALVLGTMGILLVRRGPPAWVTPLCMLAYTGYYLVFYGSPRYRMPIEGYFLAWSGITVVAAARLVPRLARARAPAWGAALTVLLAAILGQSALAAASARAALHRPDLLIATGEQFPVVTSEPSIPFFPDQPIPLDRARGRYLRLAFNAHRQGPFRTTPLNGLVRITFLDRDGDPVDWSDNPQYVLGDLPADRWTPVALKVHVPPAAASCEVTLQPERRSPDTVIIDEPSLRYARGNELALEFLFPYLRFRE